MLLMCLTSCFATTVEIPGRNLYVQNGMAGQAYSLSHVDGVFRVTSGSEQFDIKSYNVRGVPEGITSEQLTNDDLYFRLNQNGQHSVLTANARLRGGHHHHVWHNIVKIVKTTVHVIKEVAKVVGPVVGVTVKL